MFWWGRFDGIGVNMVVVVKLMLLLLMLLLAVVSGVVVEVGVSLVMNVW